MILSLWCFDVLFVFFGRCSNMQERRCEGGRVRYRASNYSRFTVWASECNLWDGWIAQYTSVRVDSYKHCRREQWASNQNLFFPRIKKFTSLPSWLRRGFWHSLMLGFQLHWDGWETLCLSICASRYSYILYVYDKLFNVVRYHSWKYVEKLSCNKVLHKEYSFPYIRAFRAKDRAYMIIMSVCSAKTIAVKQMVWSFQNFKHIFVYSDYQKLLM